MRQIHDPAKASDRGAGRAPDIVVIGGGFAGFHALRRLQRILRPDQATLTLVTPNDYLLYSPLLPEVATGVLDPRDITVSLRQSLRRTRRVLGWTTAVDFPGQTVTVTGTDGSVSEHRWDRLMLAPGSVTRQFGIPGVTEHAYSLKTVDEAIFLRNHVLALLDLAETLPDTPAGRAQRQELLTVVNVGAGYTGTEFVAQMQNWITCIASRWASFGPGDVKWLLIDVASHVLPELGPQLGDGAMKLLARRGVDIRLGVSVASATSTSVTLTDGSTIPTRTLVWSAGVAPSPLIAQLGLPTSKGRLVVTADLAVPGIEHVWAAGDAAAVPDLTQPVTANGGAAGTGHPITPPTAQHAQRQGAAVARNVAASLGVGEARPYKHHDLGLVADLGGTAAVARVIRVHVAGVPAKAAARGYHLLALPSGPAKIRLAAGWLLAAALPTRVVHVSNVRPADALIPAAEATQIYPAREPSGDSPTP